MDFSREFGLAPNIVEKDYMLGWLLAGISHLEEFRTSWVFKGGTCLKKCYFETYRFSEDLDFTITVPEHQNESFLIEAFKRIAGWIYENAGIEIPSEKIRFEIIQSKIGRINTEGRIYYKGPLGFGGAHPRIKLDLTAAELLVLDPVERDIHHPYSDSPINGIKVRSYCFEEIFAEKLRALSERLRPRDLYDVVHLYRYGIKGQNRELILDTLKRKCEFKGISVPSISILESKPERAELESEWENMLGHQVPVLPPFNQYWEELPTVFDWLLHLIEAPVQSYISNLGQNIDDSWYPPAMAQAWHVSAPIEKIRYAASTRLCVNLTYGGTDRLIEPYSLRRTRDGNLLLYAVKHESGEMRSYRIDRIQNANVTCIAFQPKYAIEISDGGRVAIPYVASKDKEINEGQSRHIPLEHRRPRIAKSISGPKYVFQCPICLKRFSHQTNNSRLSEHKNRQGYPCPGRIGNLVATKY